MLAQEYYDFHQGLARQGIILSFTGYLSEGILFALGDALRQKMALDEADANITKKVFSVFVEQVQNIIRYSAERVEGDLGRHVELSSGTITVGREDDRFFVVCGNVVRREDAAALRERLSVLAAMSKDELKLHYKEKLREPPEEHSKGASLGLIEIARRASAPIQFDFLAIDDSAAFFCLKAYI
ncbi:MAG TPA: SiaB family protein kinase [Rhodocyclaceae bacterium]|nr:SiaB family protein kinase [Rhodocyclaceae bacterium]